MRWLGAALVTVGLVGLGCDSEGEARCEDTERSVPWADPIDGGRSGQDWIDELAGDLFGTLTWHMPTDEVTGDIPEGETDFTMNIAQTGDAAIFVESKRVGGGDEDRLYCGSTIRLPVDVKFETDDGALDLQVSGRLYAWPDQDDHIFGALEFVPSDNAGTLELGVANPDDYENRIASRLAFDLRSQGGEGSITLEAVSEAVDDERSSMLPEFYEQIAAFEGVRD